MPLSNEYPTFKIRRDKLNTPEEIFRQLEDLTRSLQIFRAEVVTAVTESLDTPIDPKAVVNEFLTIDGDGTTIDLNVDGSGPAANADFIIPDTVNGHTVAQAEIARITFYIADNSFKPKEFAAIPELTTGLSFRAYEEDGTTLIADWTPHDITKNGHFGLLCGPDINVVTSGGSSWFIARWTFARFSGAVILRPGQILRMLIQDDLTGIISPQDEFHVNAQGKYIFQT